MTHSTVDAVIEQVANAFAGVKREEGITLHEADVIDDYGTEEERTLARAQDLEENWEDVSAKDIETYDWILNHLDAKGF